MEARGPSDGASGDAPARKRARVETAAPAPEPTEMAPEAAEPAPGTTHEAPVDLTDADDEAAEAPAAPQPARSEPERSQEPRAPRMVVARLAAGDASQSEHGVAKPRRQRLDVRTRGVRRDKSRYRGRYPEKSEDVLGDETDRRAFSLQAADVYGKKSSVEIGALGENMTVTGARFDSFKEGMTLGVGTVELVVTFANTPCTKLNPLKQRLKTEGRKSIIWDGGKEPAGRRGWFAKVTKEGQIEEGDEVRIVAMPPEPKNSIMNWLKPRA